MRRKKFTALTFMGAAAVALAGSVAPANAAPSAIQAISKGRIQLCAQGNYAAQITFNSAAQDGQGIGTDFIAAGTCLTVNVPSYSPYLTGVSFLGKYNTSNSTFYIGGLNIAPNSPGRKFAVRGTTENAGAGAYLVELPNS